MTISVVLFDLDDTLFDHQFAVASGVLAHRQAHGGAMAAADAATELARWLELEDVHYHRYLAGELDYPGQRRVRVRAFVEPYGIDLEHDHAADEWFDGYRIEYTRAWRLHDDALPCLDALDAAGVRVGVITNGDPGFQGEKVEAVGLADRLEHVIASGELGVAKPDARIFAHACAVFGVEPSAAAYIGDRLQTDAIGAADAGLTGVWLDRGGEASADERAAAAASGVRIITTLTEVPGILAAKGR